MSFSFILSMLKLVVSLSNYFMSRGWIAEGEQRERARAMAEVLSSLSIATKVSDQIKVLTNEEVDKFVEDNGWYRD